MDPVMAIVLMVSCYVGGSSGGSISSILLKTLAHRKRSPPHSTVTRWRRRARLEKHWGWPSRRSFGTIFSAIVMLVASPMLAQAALSFQSAEYFGLGLIGLSCITSIGAKNQTKAVVSVMIGLMIGTIGTTASTASNALLSNSRRCLTESTTYRS